MRARTEHIRECRRCKKEFTSGPALGRGKWDRYCSDACRATKIKKQVRYLKAGEKVPTTEPHRYLNAYGYVRLRWHINANIVEVMEHRVRDGYVVTSPHVHHRNRNRADNSSENLVGLTAEDHAAEHRVLDHEAIAQAYASGSSEPEVARLFGCNPATVHRIVVGKGIPTRSASDRYPMPDRKVVEAAHAASRSAVEVAQRLNVNVARARLILKRYNLSSYPAGRRPGR